MRLHTLRTYNLPDIGDHLIHFTGRLGPKANVEERIEQLPSQERLAHILVEGVVRGFETFGSEAPVVCLSESTKASVPKLIQEGRYEPCGIGFSKQLVFEKSGGPALYVRGDEWQTMTNIVPQPARSRLVRFWPGADADLGEHLSPDLLRPAEWLHEREWRVPTEFRFDWRDVRFLIVPHPRWQAFYADWIEGWAGEEYAGLFMNIPAVVISSTGNVQSDQFGIWT